MNKKTAIVMISLLILLGTSGYGVAEPIVISVDATQNVGDMLTGLGFMGVWSEAYNPLETEIEDLNVKPVWRLHFGMGLYIPGGDSEIKPENFEEDFQSFLNNVVDPQIKQYQDAGYQIIISLTEVPKWLSLYPSDECMPMADGCFAKWAFAPPKDYIEWRNILQLLVSTQKTDGINAEYIIGDEPDWMFYGTEEQYLELYGHSVNAIKEIDGSIQVGAPGVSNWTHTKYYNCPAEATGLEDGVCPSKNQSMIKALIDYVAANNIPLDFIDWHFPNPHELRDNVNTTKQWLQEAGLPVTLPLTIGEWVFSPKGEDESTEKASAYAIHLLKAFLDSGIYRNTATSIYDQTGWESGDWAHVGFFSKDGILRVKLNSIKAIDKLMGQRVKAETTDENHFVAIASKDNGKIAVLTSHFITSGEEAVLTGLDSFSDQSNVFVQTCIEPIDNGQKAFYNLYVKYLIHEVTIDIIEAIFINNCGSFPEYLRTDFINSKQIAYQVYNKEIPYQINPQEVELKMTNLDPGIYTYKKYIIDGDMDEIHSNPCRYNKKTESIPTETECGMNGALDQAIAQARDSSRSVTIDYLISCGYPQAFAEGFIDCYEDTECDASSLAWNYLQQYPEAYETLNQDLDEAIKLRENILYHGTYTASDGSTYTIPIYVDQINNFEEVSLEGSKQEKAITITDRTYTENFTMQPYAVVLIEISLSSHPSDTTPITVTAPNGGEIWKAGTVQTIRWTYEGNLGSFVKIELLKGGVLNRTIASYAWIGTGGSGSYNWLIPYAQAAGEDYRIRITSLSNPSITNQSGEDFTLY
ncbi:hypothetical protein KY328_00280 [Candidatus Woesearchaeota archaeon]|nr:hypothetical protein [Candidatus Woesearchaeota archaeon]